MLPDYYCDEFDHKIPTKITLLIDLVIRKKETDAFT